MGQVGSNCLNNCNKATQNLNGEKNLEHLNYQVRNGANSISDPVTAGPNDSSVKINYGFSKFENKEYLVIEKKCKIILLN